VDEMKAVKRFLTGIMVASTAIWACQAGDAGSGSDDSNVTSSDCQVFVVPQQKSLGLAEFAKQFDQADNPVFKKILSQGCAGTFPTIIKGLNDGDKGKCKSETRIISELSQQLGHADSGRALVSRTCGNSPPELFFLLDPVDTSKVKDVPNDVEVIGNVDGVFSFYAREQKNKADSNDKDTVWKFFGTSKSFVEQGYDCDPKKFHGACQSLAARDEGVKGQNGARCASCHPGGGLVQKELNSPWTSWQNPPGASGYVTANTAMLGTLADGLSLEPISTGLNATWAKKRFDVLKATKNPVVDVLRPLFCTLDINLQAQGGPTPADDLFVDPVFSGASSASVSFQNTLYKKVLGDTDQKFHGTLPGKHDTADAFMYLERSQLDADYINVLKSKVGEAFVRDVLFVDFTRPIYSPVRCGLLEAADGLKSLDSAPKDILAAAQRKKLPGADELARAMASTEPAKTRHTAAVGAYVDACADRSQKEPEKYLPELMEYISQTRREARLLRVQLKGERTKKSGDNAEGDFGIIDFSETLPVDKFDKGDEFKESNVADKFFSQPDLDKDGKPVAGSDGKPDLTRACRLGSK
jgi:hypothetical protein